MNYLERRADIVDTLGFFWAKIFLDADFVSGFTNSVALLWSDLDQLAERIPNYLGRITIPTTESREIRLFAFNEIDLDRATHHYGDPGLTYAQAAHTYGEEGALEVWKYPLGGTFVPEFMSVGVCSKVSSTTVILQRNVDYTVADEYISFKTDPLKLTGLTKRLYYQENIPYYSFMLWGFKLKQDIEAFNTYFSGIAGVFVESTPRGREAMNIAWDLRVEGASVKNIGRLLSVLTDSDYVDKSGTVREIYPEGNKWCIRSDNAVYTAPLEATVKVVVGESFVAGDQLFDIYTLRAGSEDIDFTDFEGLHLGKEFWRDLGDIFLPNYLERVSREHPDNWYEVVPYPSGVPTVYLLVDKDGKIIGSTASEEEASELIVAAPEDLYVFYVGGSDANVHTLMTRLNASGNDWPSFINQLKTKYGKVPSYINPMKEIRELFLRNNVFFIKIKYSLLDSQLAARLLTVLKKTINAGTCFFVLIEKPNASEIIDLTKITETVTPWYALDTTDNYTGLAEITRVTLI